jgi:hypothetical protein
MEMEATRREGEVLPESIPILVKPVPENEAAAMQVDKDWAQTLHRFWHKDTGLKSVIVHHAIYAVYSIKGVELGLW